MPQREQYYYKIICRTKSMSLLLEQTRQSEPLTTLVETPVKEREKIHPKIMSRQNTCAMDVMGLSWIFQEDDYS